MIRTGERGMGTVMEIMVLFVYKGVFIGAFTIVTGEDPFRTAHEMGGELFTFHEVLAVGTGQGMPETISV